MSITYRKFHEDVKFKIRYILSHASIHLDMQPGHALDLLKPYYSHEKLTKCVTTKEKIEFTELTGLNNNEVEKYKGRLCSLLGRAFRYCICI